MNTYKDKKILAIIPARGGSKRIPKKNIKLLLNKPLIVYTIESALRSSYLDRVVVSTDDKEIAEISKKAGAQVIKRPKDLAKDATPTPPVIENVLACLKKTENYKPDIILLLQPTSPLRNVSHINEALNKFFKKKYDSLLSVCPFYAFLWRIRGKIPVPLNYNFRERPRSQDKKLEYKENGAIYITKYNILKKERNILGGKIGLYVMPEECSIDIDTEFDFLLCEAILKGI